MRQKFVTFMLALLATTALFAQNKVTGTVTDNIGPVIGASVMEKGTNNGAITDLDGNYTITVRPGATLVFSSIGYATQEIAVGSQSVINVVLGEDTEFLDEVVVVGYGTMKKSDLAGASVSMKEDAIKGSIITNIDQSLQGRAAGVQSVATSGAPGSSSAIRVRGQATINANAEPLYVIDGVIMQGGGQSGADFGLGDALGNGAVSTISPLSTINPSDIVSMEILKDASATAIYGAQGANGVVLITTKRGKSGDAKFTYDGMVAVQRQTKRIDLLNLREFAEYYNELASGGMVGENDYYSDPSILGKGTNWQDAIFRTALQHQHQISAQGGTDKVQYYVSGSFMDQQGTIIGSEFKRFSVRANLDAQLKDWWKIGLSATYSSTDENMKLADSDEGIIGYSLTSLPSAPIYDQDGNYYNISMDNYSIINPVAMAMLEQILLKRQKLAGNIFSDITFPFLKQLTWHAELGYDISYSKVDTFNPSVSLGSYQRAANETRSQKNNSLFWQLKNYLTYANTFGKHSITAMVGQEAWESKYDYSSVFNTALPSNDVVNPYLGTGTPTIGYGFGSSSMASFFTRETYNYDNRYIGTYTFRYDGSSNFGPNKRWAPFHSVALAWRFTNEHFFPESVKNVLSDAKLRFGWGQTGNASIGGYKWGTTMSKVATGLGTGYRQANMPNPDIMWEKQEQFNVGLDLSFWNNRLNLVVDWYDKRSNDMLMPLQMPTYMGTSGNGSSALAAPFGNYGSIQNTGWEFTLSAHPVETKDFRWSTEGQLSFNSNKLLALSGTASAAIVGYGQWNDIVSVSNIGEPLFSFYGYQTDGIFQSMEEVMAGPVQGDKMPHTVDADGVWHPSQEPADYSQYSTTWVGDIRYKDLNGDGRITEADRTNIGSPMPKFTFGWTNTFTYKNWDLTIFINGSYGNKVLNYLNMRIGNMKSAWANQPSSVLGRTRLEVIDPLHVYDGTDNIWNWYEDIENVRVSNPTSVIPRATTGDPNDNDRLSDRYIEDGSYIRLKNITLGYTFPKRWMEKCKIESLRVQMNIQNLLTLTKYTGYDPEIGVSTASVNVMGLDNGRYPSPTVYSLGVNVTF
ncbi:MAG: TonB-dependent receptor [Bacteroidales bacterium]|nr:TonB-dependent receptor [Bacteroidales bacterium]